MLRLSVWKHPDDLAMIVPRAGDWSQYSETCDERPPLRTTESGLLRSGGASSEVQMYGNVGPCYCNSGLSSEVGRWSFIAGFTVQYY